jgi:hypothetical protein
LDEERRTLKVTEWERESAFLEERKDNGFRRSNALPARAKRDIFLQERKEMHQIHFFFLPMQQRRGSLSDFV